MQKLEPNRDNGFGVREARSDKIQRASSAPGGSRQNDLGDNRIGHDDAAVIQVAVINGSSARRFIFGHLLLT